jgi:hypothetical protein
LAIIINVLQAYKPNWLPVGLRTWLWLPRPLRSLGWYDENIFGRQCCCCCKKKDNLMTIENNIHENGTYISDQLQENV